MLAAAQIPDIPNNMAMARNLMRSVVDLPHPDGPTRTVNVFFSRNSPVKLLCETPIRRIL